MIAATHSAEAHVTPCFQRLQKWQRATRSISRLERWKAAGPNRRLEKKPRRESFSGDLAYAGRRASRNRSRSRPSMTRTVVVPLIHTPCCVVWRCVAVEALCCCRPLSWWTSDGLWPVLAVCGDPVTCDPAIVLPVDLVTRSDKVVFFCPVLLCQCNFVTHVWTSTRRASRSLLSAVTRHWLTIPCPRQLTQLALLWPHRDLAMTRPRPGRGPAVTRRRVWPDLWSRQRRTARVAANSVCAWRVFRWTRPSLQSMLSATVAVGRPAAASRLIANVNGRRGPPRSLSVSSELCVLRRCLSLSAATSPSLSVFSTRCVGRPRASGRI